MIPPRSSANVAATSKAHLALRNVPPRALPPEGICQCKVKKPANRDGCFATASEGDDLHVYVFLRAEIMI